MLAPLKSIAQACLPSALFQKSRRSKFKRCLVHIGIEKTGTTSIQRFLRLNRDAFARDGVYFPLLRKTHGASHWEFAARASDKICGTYIGQVLGIHSSADWVDYKDRFDEVLTNDLSHYEEVETLLISCEQLSSHLYDRSDILELKACLSEIAEDVTVLLYLRRQDRVARSLYSTKLLSGQVDPELFPDLDPSALPYYFNYASIVGNWSDVFGDDALEVRLYGKDYFVGGDLLSDFCDAGQLRLDGKMRPSDSNKSLSLAGLHFVSELNRQWPHVYGEEELFRAELVDWVAHNLRGKGAVCSRSDAQAFYAHFVESNERLRAHLFPSRGQLFDEDFSDYPEVLDESPARYEDAIEIFVRAWQWRSEQSSGRDG